MKKDMPLVSRLVPLCQRRRQGDGSRLRCLCRHSADAPQAQHQRDHPAPPTGRRGAGGILTGKKTGGHAWPPAAIRHDRL